MNERKRQRNKGRDRDMKEGTKEIIISLIMLNAMEFSDTDCSEFD